MDMDDAKQEPAWVPGFLAALREGRGVRGASRAAGVASSTPYHRRKTDADFRAAWDAVRTVDARRSRPAPRRKGPMLERFLEELGHSSNVAAAAAAAGLTVGRIYHLRRTDPEFARRWYAALAEGYDNLEMEMLQHLRSGESGGRGAAGPRPKFDVATALRCLTAHRESVAREKGRRTLAQEAATIASINAKIDALRANAHAGDKAVALARKALKRQAPTQGRTDRGAQ